MIDIFKPYKYLFYRIYSWNLKMWGKEDVPQYNALFGVSFLTFLNFYFLVNVIAYIAGIDFFKMVGYGKICDVLLGIAIGIFGYFVLVKDGRYKKIAEQFGTESKGVRRRNLVLCVLYVASTLVVAFSWPNAFHPK